MTVDAECRPMTEDQQSDNAREAGRLTAEGERLADEGRKAEAIRYFQKAIRLAPEFYVPYNNLGVMLWEAGELGDALTCFEEALRLAPDDRDTVYNVGQVLCVLDRRVDAEHLYSLYCQAHPEDTNFAQVLEELRNQPADDSTPPPIQPS